MDMFNKLKSAVSSALPGNPLAKDFEVFGQIGVGGPGMLWKIYNAVKKTTKQDAAVFVFEKKSIERYTKREKDIIVDSLKKGISQLTRLRHPKILSVIQPLEESRESLAFATEPVFCSLANMLGNHDNLPPHVVKELEEHKLFEVEIKYGLLQLTEALQFLHNDAKILHNNLCPESVIINKNGAWKLAGFDFCVLNQNPPEQAPLFPYKDWDPDIPPCARSNLDYRAPEYALTESCSLASDMFSLGIVIYAVFNSGKPMYECHNQYNSYKKNAEELRKWRGSLLGKMPQELQEYVKLLLNTEPAVRPDADQLAKISFFEDVGSITLQYMDSLFQQDNLQKSKFFKGLPKIIVKFPKRVNLQRILPPLLKECVNPEMIPFVLPNILQIAEQASDKEYIKHVLPDLIPMFKITSPVQILLIFMQNINLLLKKTPAADIKAHVLPMIYRAMESDIPQIQELCLEVIPTFADLIEYTALKNAILPRVKKLCLSTTAVGVRVNCLLCIGKLMECMDKWVVLDDVLPLLPQIPSREPAVLMSLLGIYRVAFTHPKLGITKDILASKVLPFLTPLCIDNNLNLQQFLAFVGLIKEMVEKIETEHRSKLEQLDQMKQEQKNLQITKITEQDDKTLVPGIDNKPRSMMDDFLSGFGMARISSGSMKTSTTTGSGSSGTMSAVNGDKSSAGTPPPTKTPLSLEEKQRLAKQQEQQRIMKNQRPLEAKSNSTAAAKSPMAARTANSTPSNKPTDLTSSLMNSNMMSMSNSQSKPAGAMSGGVISSIGGGGGFNSMMINKPPLGPNYNPGASASGLSSTFGMSTSTGMSSGVSSGMSMGTYSGMPSSSFNQSSFEGPSSSSAQSTFGGATSGMPQQQNKTMDLSSFDNLMGNSSKKPTMSLNQMSSGSSLQPQQGMMGQQSMMGNQGFMGQQQRMMGNQNARMNSPAFGGGFGGGAAMNSGPVFGGQQGGGMGGGFQQPRMMASQGMMQPQISANQPSANVSANASKELDDLFG